MSSAHRWSKFWWQDWQRDPSLRACGLEARGLWMELLCIAHEGTPYGHVTIGGNAPTMAQLALICGASITKVEKLMKELARAGVYSVTENGIVFCRRMVRDNVTSEAGKSHISKRWDPTNGTPPNRDPSSSPTSPPSRKPNGVAHSLPTRTPNTLESEAKKIERKGSKGEGAGVAARPPALRPEDWQPGDQLIAFGRTLGMNRATVAMAADRMRDHVLATGRRPRNWDAMFRNWLRGDAERGRSKLSQFDQIHAELGTTSLLRPDWDDDEPPTILGRLLQ